MVVLKNLLVVAVALIKRDPGSPARVLLAQRPQGKRLAGLWEFPGGKLEPGETPEEALCRELQEELAIKVRPKGLEPLTFASHSYNEFHLLMPLFRCDVWDGDPRGAEGQQIRWVSLDELDGYDYPAADVPLLPSIRRVLSDDTR